MPRDLYLAAYRGPPRANHFSLWIPLAPGHCIGKVIHVVGDFFKGYEHEFKREYNISKTKRLAFPPLLLCSVDDKYVVDVSNKAKPGELDKEACDTLERIALSVPAPGRAPPELLPTKPSDYLRKELPAGLKHCQTWLREYLEALIAAGIAPAQALQTYDGMYVS